MSAKGDLHKRLRSIGLYRRHVAGETIRKLAAEIGKTEKQVTEMVKIGERFAAAKPNEVKRGKTLGEQYPCAECGEAYCDCEGRFQP